MATRCSAIAAGDGTEAVCRATEPGGIRPRLHRGRVIEDVTADAARPLQPVCPAGFHIIRMVMRRAPDRIGQLTPALAASVDLPGDLFCFPVGLLIRDPIRLAVTGKGELAGVAQMVVLIDHATNAVRIVLAFHPVQNDAGYGTLPLDGLASCLEIDGPGESLHFLLVAQID